MTERASRSGPTLYCWNPKRKRFSNRLLHSLPLYKRPKNFGDLLGPMIAARLLDKYGYRGEPRVAGEPDAVAPNLLTIGSVLHFARDGDIVWGSGRNGKIPDEAHTFENIDIRMVRGPLTKSFLEARGFSVPNILGDPGILVAELFPELRALAQKKHYELTVIPNLNDQRAKFSGYPVTNPTEDTWRILERIARSKLVVSASLHGIIVAEALGAPVRVLRSDAEPEFKYLDYFLGTGRSEFTIYETIDSSISGISPELPSFDAKRMIEAFPYDLFC
ncbi:MAG: polysaccharide pyruvyl transferase family protein [Spiribacter salinus]|uniref:Polysaccharide pyruvyl transferase family protein n=1 Tax=Spiribacter salinus TaxID=1335746 RepID=A0A540VNT6_9GAMM|nr:MAG: polysaccharide pyruvyl transferase family protein [Spiribacter salinus]